MSKKSKVLIVVLSVVAVLIIAGAAVFAVISGGGKDYYSYISRGQEYMAKNDYDKAIDAFSKAMNMDTTKTEAYSCLAQAYMANGSNTMAQSILSSGIDATGSITLSLMMTDLFESSTAESNGTTEITEKTAESSAIALNSDMLDFISAATFGDYQKAYGVSAAEINGNTYSYSVEKLGITISYTNSSSKNKINSNTKEPYREYMPDSITIDNLATLFGVNSITYDQIRKLPDISNLQTEDDTLSFDCEGCTVTISMTDGTVMSDSYNTVSISEANAKKDDEDNASPVTGKVIDVTTGSGISDVTLKAYVGYSASGTPVQTKTDSSGNYTLNLPSGDNYIEVSKDGYITATGTVYVLSSGNNGVNFELSRELGSGQMRIVLTWNSVPADLDSHLVGTTDSGSYVHTAFYNQKVTNSSGDTIAELDLDDTDGSGPETTTIYDLNGTYEFYVDDFGDTGLLSSSGAQVLVYSGNSLVKTVDVCSGCGKYWSVIRIDHGNVTVTNVPKS